jgi:DnaJ-class molecular chaperone
MVLVDCKKCNGTGRYTYKTRTGMRTRICNQCSSGKVDIFYVEVRSNVPKQV